MNSRLSATLAALGSASFVALGTACAYTPQPSAPSAKMETQSATAAFNLDDTIKSVEKTLKPLMDAVTAEDRAYETKKRFEVTAFGQNPDGEGTLLRVWEQAGTNGELIVTLPGKFKSATPVNLRGEKSDASFPIQSGKLTLNLPAYAPASFVLE